MSGWPPFHALAVKQVKHRLAKKDVRPLLEDPGSVDEPTEAILLRSESETIEAVGRRISHLKRLLKQIGWGNDQVPAEDR